METLYEQVRAHVQATAHDVPATLTSVAPGIRVLALRTPTLPPAAHTNVYLVGPETGPQMAVDPGSPYPDEQVRLDDAIASEAAAGRPLAMVLLTHHHGDHAGGAAALAARWNVPIAAHAATARRRPEVTRVLADGEHVGDVTCLWTPGHADGHLCFEHDGAMIAGDMVAGLGWILIDPVEGDMAHYLASLERMRSRKPTVLLPAHGPAITDPEAKLVEYIAHRTMREQRVVAALAARTDASIERFGSAGPRSAAEGQRGASIDELVPEVYADTLRGLWPLAARSLRAHVDKLVREGRAREIADGRWTSR